jgi:hypothetical protein
LVLSIGKPIRDISCRNPGIFSGKKLLSPAIENTMPFYLYLALTADYFAVISKKSEKSFNFNIRITSFSGFFSGGVVHQISELGYFCISPRKGILRAYPKSNNGML